MLKSLSN